MVTLTLELMLLSLNIWGRVEASFEVGLIEQERVLLQAQAVSAASCSGYIWTEHQCYKYMW